MGYNISVRCRSKELKNQMEKFFKENYRFPHQIFKDFRNLEGKSRVLTENPSMTFAQFYEEYHQNSFDEYSVGLYYGCVSDRYHLYIQSIVSWMAQIAGRRYYFKNLGQSYPYIKNDVHGVIPLVPVEKRKDIPKTVRRYLIDKLGKIIYPPTRDVTKIDLIFIRHEIKRLDMLWKKENQPK